VDREPALLLPGPELPLPRDVVSAGERSDEPADSAQRVGVGGDQVLRCGVGKLRVI
jgi:hypothetical protein